MRSTTSNSALPDTSLKEPTEPLTLAPQHIAIIMDGNGRWARERGLPRRDGHRAGAESLREILEACIETGVSHLTVYAFSSENWNRPPEEIKALMSLLEHFLKEKTHEMMQRNVKLTSIGRTDMLPKKTRKQLHLAEEKTANNTKLTLNLALSYGSREEIVDAARQIAQKAAEGRIQPEDIDNNTISAHLYTAGTPDPDLLIRTSGELRLSNFMLWQISYAEIVISEKYWPEFRKAEFHQALDTYRSRHRRFGAL